MFMKIFTAGHVVPSDETILSFKRAVQKFLQDNADNGPCQLVSDKHFKSIVGELRIQESWQLHPFTLVSVFSLLMQTNWSESTAPTAWTAPAIWSAGVRAHSLTHPQVSVWPVSNSCVSESKVPDRCWWDEAQRGREAWVQKLLPSGGLATLFFKSRQMWCVFSVFNSARGHSIERQNYLEDLHCGPKRRWCTKTMMLSNIHVCMQILLWNLLRKMSVCRLCRLVTFLSLMCC